MGSLIPEARVNVNGVSVIKHVRADAQKSPIRAMPAPALPSTARKSKKAKEPSKARTEKSYWTEDPRKSRADSALKAVAKKRFPNGWYLGHSSDVDAYEVMSVTSPVNAMLLIACGAKTSEAAIEFLEEHGLSHLIEDHSELANAALERNIPAEALYRSCSELGVVHWSEPNFLDAVEAYSIKALRGEDEFFNGLPFQILHGRVNLSDVKIVGATRLAAEGSSSVASEHLKRIKDGTSPFDARALKAIMMKVNPKGIKRRADEVIQMAGVYGSEVMLEIHDYERAFDLERRLRRANHPTEDIPELMLWNDRLQKIEFHPLSSEKVVMLHATGIEPARASELLNSGLEPEQIVGVMEHDVPVSVADGWI